MIETLGDILRHNAHKFPDEPAYIWNDAPVSFAALFERAQKLSSALWAIGLRPQDRLAIYSQNTIEFMEAYAACELTGYIASGVNWRLAAPEIAAILADARPRVLAFEAQYAPIVEQIRGEAPFIETYLCFGGEIPDWAEDFHRFVESGDPAGAPARSTADQIAHLIYTSGTTGRPKGVMRTQAGEVAAALLFAAECGFTIAERLQISMPVFHVGARFLQMGVHARGGCVVLHHAFSAEETARAIGRHKVTATHMAPTMVQALLDLPQIEAMDLSSLQTVVYSAAPMPTPLLRRGLARLGPVFLQLYGMTEGAGTTLHKRQHRLDGTADDDRRLGSVGQAAPSIDIRIVGDAGEALPLGSPGEIVIRTDTRMLGYWNNTAATLEVLNDGWYASGDVGILDENGFLYLVDRKKDMIVSGGENIYSREVEEALAAHPAVRDAAVIGVPDPYWGETVHAVVVADPPLTAEALIEHSKTLIASYKKPKSIAFVGALPRLPSGKIDKVRLRAVYGGD